MKTNSTNTSNKPLTYEEQTWRFTVKRLADQAVLFVTDHAGSAVRYAICRTEIDVPCKVVDNHTGEEIYRT